MRDRRFQVKLTIAKLILLSYSKNEGITAKIMAEAGGARLTVDQRGHVSLSGQAGIVSFSGQSVLESISLKIRRVSVTFRDGKGMTVGYSASVHLYKTTLGVSGQIDLEKLITSCSGLLCQAARLLKRQDVRINKRLREALGE